MVGVFDYAGWPRRRLHNPRTACGDEKLEIRKTANQAVKNECEKWGQKKKQPGRSAEGPRDPGLSCPPPQ
jgi:hypothetical protein